MHLGTLRTDLGLRPVAKTPLGYLDIGQALGIHPEGFSLISVIRDWKNLQPQLDEAIQEAGKHPSPAVYPTDERRLAPPVPQPGKIVCIGLNYQAHAREVGARERPHPEVFLRVASSLAGPRDDVWLPAVSEQLDLEVELCAVVGRGGRYLSPGDALEAVFGWTVFNDLSVRDFQSRGRQWTPGKNFDRSGPCGPFVVTRDELPDPSDLTLTSSIDGVEMQRSSTRDLIFDVARLVSDLSTFMTLAPGDLIATGTPQGVGLARVPQRWLKAGETVVCTIEGIGSLKNTVVPEPAKEAWPGP